MKHISTICHIIFVAFLFTLQPAPAKACSEVTYSLVWPDDAATNVPTNTYLVFGHRSASALTAADINATLTDSDGNDYALTTTFGDTFFSETAISFLPTDGDLPASTVFTFTIELAAETISETATFTTASGPDEVAPIIQDATVTELNYYAAGETSCGPYDEYIRLSVDWTYAEDDFGNTFIRYSNSDPDDAEYDWTGSTIFYVDDFESSVNLMLQARDYSGNVSDVVGDDIDLTPTDTTADSTVTVNEELSVIESILCGSCVQPTEETAASSCSLSANAAPQSLAGFMVIGALLTTICIVKRQTI